MEVFLLNVDLMQGRNILQEPLGLVVCHVSLPMAKRYSQANVAPAVMRLNEIMGIQQSRTWGVCSLNEFRKVSVRDEKPCFLAEFFLSVLGIEAYVSFCS
jgi:hypothetical protein